MPRINVLSIQQVSAEDRVKIEAVDPVIQFIDAGGWYDGEIRETWPAFSTARYLAPNAVGSGTREERDRLLAGRCRYGGCAGGGQLCLVTMMLLFQARAFVTAVARRSVGPFARLRLPDTAGTIASEEQTEAATADAVTACMNDERCCLSAAPPARQD